MNLWGYSLERLISCFLNIREHMTAVEEHKSNCRNFTEGNKKKKKKYLTSIRWYMNSVMFIIGSRLSYPSTYCKIFDVTTSTRVIVPLEREGKPQVLS